MGEQIRILVRCLLKRGGCSSTVLGNGWRHKLPNAFAMEEHVNSSLVVVVVVVDGFQQTEKECGWFSRLFV